MKEIPMLFSTPMVQALLAGRKTQTRRLVKMPKDDITDAKWGYTAFTPPGYISFRGVHANGQYGESFVKCPYGQPGDLLYVREEHYQYGHWVEKEGVYTKGGRQKWMFVPTTDEVFYEAPAEFRKGRHHKDPYTPAWHKRLARFMPKSASRIWLKKTATRVERVCDISREDAIAEGLACISKDGGRTYKYGIPDIDGLPGTDNIGWPWHEWEVDPIEAFKKLWIKINGAETWNSWVWVNSFEIISTTGKPSLLTENVNNE